MSNPNPNSSASVPVPPPPVTASETPATPPNNVRTRPSQPPPTPPPLPSPYRAIAPLQYVNPFQWAQNNLQSRSIPYRRPNPARQLHFQDPTSVLYPFAPPVPGLPVRLSSPLVADQSGYPPLPVLAYNYGQFGPNQMEAMLQFMRARSPQIRPVSRPGSGSPVSPVPMRAINPQIRPLSHPGSGSPVSPVPMRGVPNFLQPRVPAPPPTSVLDTGRNQNARRPDGPLVVVQGRKVRITEGDSLYSLSRSWLRNGAPERVQPERDYKLKLPKPLPKDVMEAAVPNDPAEELTDEDKEDEEAVKDLSANDLLKRHIERAKKVRARKREERMRKIARYKERLAIILAEAEKSD